MEILILALLGPETPVGANLKCKGEGVVPWLVGAWARPGPGRSPSTWLPEMNLQH